MARKILTTEEVNETLSKICNGRFVYHPCEFFPYEGYHSIIVLWDNESKKYRATSIRNIYSYYKRGCDKK